MSVPIQVLRDDGSQELEFLSHSAVYGESAGGFILKSTIISTVLSVLSSRLLRQFFNLLSVSGLVAILDEADECGIVCKLQELDIGVFRCNAV